MRNKHVHLAGRITFGACILMVLACISTAHAQRFEEMFGRDCQENGFSGVQTSRGGYISVGAAMSQSSNCSDQDIYVVMLNSNGSLAWARTIDIAGGNDVARDVVESFSSDGGFLITGYTDRAGCDNMGRQDMFLMRIDGSGNVQWLNTYGTSDYNELAFRLIECRYSATGSDDAGEIVVAGFRNIEDSRYDGLLLRTNSTGGIIFFKRYDGGRNDGFYGVIESHVGNNRSDLIAAGFTDSYNTSGVTNGFAIRVDMNGRFYGTAPSSAAVFGGRNTVILSHVAEQTTGRQQGALIFCGDADYNGNATDPYLVKTGPSPCRFIADRRYGDDGGNSHEETWSIQEIHDPSGTGLTDGNFIVAGLTEITGTTMPYMMEIDPSLAMAFGVGFKVYGNTPGKGYTAYPALSSSSSTTSGFYLTATAENANPDLDMYVVKTDAAGRVRCYYSDVDVRETEPKYEPRCPDVKSEDIGEMCEHHYDPVENDWITVICNDSRDDTQGKLARVILGSEGIDLYPNPVKAGSVLTISAAKRQSGSMTIIVSDLAGRILHRSTMELTNGAPTTEINTDGWKAGTYLVKITTGDRTDQKRIVIE